MSFCGVKDIPTFDNPNPLKELGTPGSLGYACRGKKIEACRSWLDAHTSNVITTKELEIALCSICKDTS